MVDRIDSIPFAAYRPMAPAEPPTRSGSEDSRRCDAGRDEGCVGAFRAGPGVVPFPDYLQALNAEARLRSSTVREADPVSQVEPAAKPVPPRRDDSLPRLGDIAPVPERPAPAPAPAPAAPIHRDTVRHTLGTGRLIDVVI